MRIGRLDKLITIERRVLIGGTSEPAYDWETHRQCWAEAYDIRSQESFSEDTKARYSEITTRFRIHYRDAAGIDSTMRVRFDGRTYDIKSVIIDHVRKQSATIDAVAHDLTVSGAALEAVADVPDIAFIGALYSVAISIFGGQGPYVASLGDGSPEPELPPGLSLVQSSANVWSIEGFPASGGAWPISVTISDAAAQAVTLQPFTITISDGSP